MTVKNKVGVRGHISSEYVQVTGLPDGSLACVNIPMPLLPWLRQSQFLKFTAPLRTDGVVGYHVRLT
jgi:hypothetical protein